MSAPPENPFSSGSSTDDDSNRFDAFQLSPDKLSRQSSLPSLQSIQAAQHQQQQRQQQQNVATSQPSTFDSLPSPDELRGPMSSTTNNNNDWTPTTTTSSTNISNTPTANYNTQTPQQTSILPKFLTCGGALSIETLRPYFDFDTSDISLRIKSSIKYCNVPDGFRNDVLYSDTALRLSVRQSADAAGGTNGNSNDGEDGESEPTTSIGTVGTTTGGGKGADLYGPTWITMTLVFFVAVTSNMSLYFHHTEKHMSIIDEGGEFAEEEWDYDINQLLHATWILYSFSFLLPMGFYVVFRLSGVNSLSMGDLICLYGYSLVPYVPTSWICVAPVSWLQWVSLCLSTVISGMLVLRNVTGPILESGAGGGGGGMGQGKSGGLIMAVIGCHFIFFLVMKLVFYHHVHTV